MLTPEQLAAAENMSLDELRAAAGTATDAAKVDDETGDAPVQAVEPEPETEDDASGHETYEESAPTVCRIEVPNGDGVDVYEGATWDEVARKVAAGKENANKKLREVIAEKRQLEAKQQQVTQDDNYTFQEEFKTNPIEALNKEIERREARKAAEQQEALEVQNRFVAAHPEYEPIPANGNKLIAWLQLHGHQKMTSEGLENAYLDLKKSGLLKLKAEGADAATTSTPTAEQTSEPEASASPKQSPKRASTISTRNARTVSPVKSAPTEDDLYKMPLEELRKLANAQLKGQ